MSEETYSANTKIPQAMILSVVINGIAGFAFVIALLYGITDPEAALATDTGFPIIPVFYQATKNKHAATAMMSAVILISGIALFSVMASTSRLVWAFSRDK